MRETILVQVSAVPVTSLNSLVLTSNAINTLTKKTDEISSTAQVSQNDLEDFVLRSDWLHGLIKDSLKYIPA